MLALETPNAWAMTRTVSPGWTRYAWNGPLIARGEATCAFETVDCAFEIADDAFEGADGAFEGADGAFGTADGAFETTAAVGVAATACVEAVLPALSAGARVAVGSAAA